MILDSRRVRTLRLKHADPAAIRGTAQLVSEALRLATFPGDGLPGQLLIRRVELGAFSARLSSQALAARVTDAVRAAAGRAVPFTAPEAHRADAVRLPRDVDTWIELARRAAGRGSLDLSAWFWQLLAPALRTTNDRRVVLELAVDALMKLDTPSPALSALLVALVDDGTATALLEVLSERQAQLALASLGLVMGAGSAGSVSKNAASALPDSTWAAHGESETDALLGWHRAAPPGLSGATWRNLLRQFVPRWGAEQARSWWLCATALWASVPARANLAGAEIRVRALARRVEESARSELQREEPDPLLRAVARDRSLAEPEALPVFTPFAGLFFVLRVLERLGLRAFLSSHPHLAEADFGRRVLLRIANELGVPDDDPVRQVVAVSAAAPSECAFEIPEPWLGSLVDAESVALRASSFQPVATITVDKHGVPLALWYREPPASALRWPELALNMPSEIYESETAMDVALDAWQHAIVAWLGVFTELDLNTLVRRNGGLQLSPTHVDLVFDLEQSDVRLRRAALDVDLGYVSQLGRVVAFHYRRRVGLAGNAV